MWKNRPRPTTIRIHLRIPEVVGLAEAGGRNFAVLPAVQPGISATEGSKFFSVGERRNVGRGRRYSVPLLLGSFLPDYTCALACGR
jgi:hypothetical protein